MIFFKKIITYVSLVAVVLVPSLLVIPGHARAASCTTITDARFEMVSGTSAVTKDGVLSFDYPNSSTPSIKILVVTQGCVGQRLPITVDQHLIGDTWGSAVAISDNEWLVPTSGKVELTVKPSGEACGSIYGYSCEFRIKAGKGSYAFSSSEHKGVGVSSGYILNYNCKNSCTSDGPWKITAKNTVSVSKTCTITSADFYTNLGPTPFDIRTAQNPGLEISITETGCIGWDAKIGLVEQQGILGNDAFGGVSASFPFDLTTSGVTRIPLIAGETGCQAGSPNCIIKATITPSNDGSDGTAFGVTNTLKYNCAVTDKCNESAFWTGDSAPYAPGDFNKKTKVGNAISGASCEVVSASFDPFTTKDGVANYQLSHLETHGWFWEDNRDFINMVTVAVTTKNCAGTSIFVDVIGTTAPVDVSAVATLHNRSFIIPTNETLLINLIAGEEGCGGGTGKDADCKFNIHTSTIGADGKVKTVRDSLNDPHGNLNYKCDKLCNSGVAWKFAGDTSAKPYPSDLINGEIPVTLEDNTTSSISPDCINKTTGNAIEGCYQLYGGFAEVLKGKFDNLNSLGDFINAIIALAIGIAGVLTVGMIMWDGFTYWKAGKEGNENDLGKVKGMIWKRLLGLLLLFTIYTLLRTINPDLLNLTPRINVVELQAASQSTLSPSDFTEITGKPLQSPSAYDAMAKEIAKKYSSDYCALRVIIQNESRGKPTVVGQDENVRDPGIPSRIAFVNSGKKYSGATFATAADLITKKGFCNDAAACAGDVPNPKSKTLGLDWRFTKGIGLTQITFYPNDYDKFKTAGFVPSYANKDIPPSRDFYFSTGKETVTPFEMFDPEKNLTISAKLWNEGIKKCGTPTGAFYTYACGNTCDCSNNAFAKAAIETRVPQYNQCKKENP